jgi:hypothetical protein
MNIAEIIIGFISNAIKLCAYSHIYIFENSLILYKFANSFLKINKCALMYSNSRYEGMGSYSQQQYPSKISSSNQPQSSIALFHIPNDAKNSIYVDGIPNDAT